MKSYEIRVTQALSGYYNGRIIVQASSEKAALNKLKRMSKKDIDEEADWTQGDEYDGDYKTIEIHEDSINEV